MIVNYKTKMIFSIFVMIIALFSLYLNAYHKEVDSILRMCLSTFAFGSAIFNFSLKWRKSQC